MADEKELEVIFTWQNGVMFKMATKATGGSLIDVIKVEENGDLANLWSGIQDLCVKTVTRQLDIIGEEMKA